MARIAGVNIPITSMLLSLTIFCNLCDMKNILATVGITETTKIRELDDAQLDVIRAEVAVKFPPQPHLRREISMRH